MMCAVASEWEKFTEQVPWFLDPGASVRVGAPEPWSRGRIAGVTRLSDLLGECDITPVEVDGRSYELLSWGSPEARLGWLCAPPEADSMVAVHPLHSEVWRVLGGIVERYAEPVTWLLNQDDVLTEGAARLPTSQVLDGMAWRWEEAGLHLSIEPAQWYPVAVEANGNVTLAHRVTGAVVLAAQDHAFECVRPLAGCPPYSLYEIEGAPDLATLVEVVAGQWLAALD
jgi:hypothetical protein